MLNDFLSGVLVVIVMGLLLQGLTLARRYRSINGELSRKSVHVSMGFLACTFPWVFQHTVSVVVLAVTTATLLLTLRCAPASFPLKAALCSTKRETFGELYFPIAVAILFAVSHEHRLFYVISILILALADAFSALVGRRYGRRKYHTMDGLKTTEGSLVFFIVAFMVAHVPLLLLTTLPKASALLIALIVAIISTLFEGISWRGIDNLLIPVGAYLALQSHIQCDVPTLALRLSMLMLLVGAVLIAKKRTTLNGSAVLGVALYTYFAWIFGGICWMVAPLVVFASYSSLLPERFRHLRSEHSILAVLSLSSTGILWMLCDKHLSHEQLLFPYVVAFAIHESIIATAHMPAKQLNQQRLAAICVRAMKSWLFLFAPLAILTGWNQQFVLESLVAPAFIIVSTLAFYLSRPARQPMFEYKSLDNVHRWFKQSAIAAVGSAMSLLVCTHFIHLVK